MSALSGRTALVSGGGGFVGGRLAEALRERGARVRVLDCREEGACATGGPREIETVRGDVRDPAAWARALDGVEVVFHLAAVVGADMDARRYLDVNAGGTAELYHAIERGASRVGRVVLASSLGVYGEGAYRCEGDGIQHPGPRPLAQLERGEWEPRCPVCARPLGWIPTGEGALAAPVSPYGVSKHAAERLALLMGRHLGVATVALRYGVVYGAGQPLASPYSTAITAFATMLARGDTPALFEDGEQRRDWVYVDDVVRATLLAAEDARADFEVLNVGAGRPCAIRELAAQLARRLGAAVVPAASGRFRAGDYRHLVLDVGKLRALGFAPAVSLEDGLDRFVRGLSPAGR